MLMTNHKRSAILKIGGPTQARPPQKQESELGPADTAYRVLVVATGRTRRKADNVGTGT